MSSAPRRIALRWPIAAVAAVCVALPVNAADWSLAGRTGARLEVDTNRDLEADSDGTVYGASVTAGLTLTGRTDQLTVTLSAGAEGALFGGPGDTDELTRLEPDDLSASVRYTGKTYTFGSRARFSVDPTSVTQIEDTGVTDTDAIQFTTSASTDLTVQLSPRTDLLFAASVDLIDFDENVDGLEPTSTYGVTTGVSHQLTRTTTGTVNVGFRHFVADNAEETRAQTVDVSAGLTHRRTARHTFGVTGGVTGVRTAEIGQGVEFDVGVTGGTSFSYRLKNLTLDLNASQSIDPSSDGELQAFTRVGGTLGYAINTRERLGLAAALSRSTPLSGDEDTTLNLTFGPNYTLALTSTTDVGFGYQFRLSQDETDGTATGHQFFLTLERRFTLEP